MSIIKENIKRAESYNIYLDESFKFFSDLINNSGVYGIFSEYEEK